MKPEAPRRILRSRILSSALLLGALVSSHACMKSDCADTESCGSFSPASGCGWRLDDDTVVYSTDDLEARDATWSEEDGWTLPNGSHPVFSCDLPANPDDDAGMNGNGGSSGEGSGNSGASNGGETGNSGASSGGNGGANGGNGGSNGGNGGSGGSTETDGGDPCSVCTAPMAQCSPEGDCVECTENTHCTTEAAPRCDTGSYACGDCTAPADCTEFPATPNCDATSGACVQCALNDHCTSTSASLCDTSNLCQPCEIDTDCEHLTDSPVCDNGECVQCTGTKYEACGTLDDVPIVCDSLNRTCLASGNLNKEHSAPLCGECFSDAHCGVGQRCVMQQYNSDDVGYFCFWEEGAGGDAPDDCFQDAQPFVDVLDQQVSIDGSEVTICGLRVSTCVAYTEYSVKNCAPGGIPDSNLCGIGNDGYCRLVSGMNYRCTMLCSTDDDCKVGVNCNSGSPDVCDL